ncbi:response regulator transcription factor [Streptomyces sp. SID8014]|uniref:response regulator n=1 Tax=Streptomyces sp. SID8014 TaxID=2706097 RepID=UPI0013B82F9F|nr:response regulator transcription factor [Streptomyces sp. SID8014]
MTIRLVLADDERMVRTALRAILGAEPDLEVVGEAATGAEAVSVVRATAPDVVLMDVRMPEVDGIRATERVLAAATAGRGPRVLVLTTFENDDHVLAALRAGAAGFLLKRSEAETLLHAVRVVACSDTLLFPASVRALALAHGPRPSPAPPWLTRLTDREREVLRLMATGLTNAEIAARLTVGSATVKSHVAAVLAKTGTRDRTQAVIAAFESGLAGDR